MKRPWFGLFFAAMLTVHAADGESATRQDGRRWLADLQGDIAADLARGKPLVVQVHVPLCDSDIIACGPRGLGDGDNLERNLYWATSGGFVGWFGRARSGWKLVHRAGVDNKDNEDNKDILEVRVWRRTFRTAPAFARRGVGKRFNVYVVAHAWRGKAIRSAMDAYTRDLYGADVRTIKLKDGTTIAAGGGAHVVSYVGHNGWMDVADYDFDAVAETANTVSTRRKGTIAVACITEDYLAADVSAATRVPLLMTRWLLFAGAHSFEGAVSALAEGKSLKRIRSAAIRSYAIGQGKKPSRVGGAFTNPADKRWKGL